MQFWSQYFRGARNFYLSLLLFHSGSRKATCCYKRLRKLSCTIHLNFCWCRSSIPALICFFFLNNILILNFFVVGEGLEKRVGVLIPPGPLYNRTWTSIRECVFRSEGALLSCPVEGHETAINRGGCRNFKRLLIQHYLTFVAQLFRLIYWCFKIIGAFYVQVLDEACCSYLILNSLAFCKHFRWVNTIFSEGSSKVAV